MNKLKDYLSLKHSFYFHSQVKVSRLVNPALFVISDGFVASHHHFFSYKHPVVFALSSDTKPFVQHRCLLPSTVVLSDKQQIWIISANDKCRSSCNELFLG